MTLKVELGFTSAGASAPFLTLDDPVRGLLNSSDWVLGGGEALVDVSAYVKSATINRGKSRELDRFNAGSASVAFNNQDRTFDPTYEASPFFGQIRPRRQIKITLDDVLQFEGTIDDWDIGYIQGGYSEARCGAVDGTQVVANIELNSYVPSSELTGARINDVLDAIGWDADKRNIDVGSQTLEADTVADGTNVFEYLQKIAASEPGDLFIAKDGSVKFVGRNSAPTSDGLQLADDGSGLGYLDIQTVFGTELLYNNITVSNSTNSISATDNDSIAAYGEVDYSLETLVNDTDSLNNLANFLLGKYSEPEFRFQSISVRLDNKSEADKDDLLNAELGDVIKVTFTPSGIPPAVVRFLKVISINVNLTPGQEVIIFGLESTTGALLVLNDSEFGKLNSGIIGY